MGWTASVRRTINIFRVQICQSLHTECQEKNLVRNQGQSDNGQGVIEYHSNSNNNNLKVIHPCHAVDKMYIFTSIVIHITD